MKIILVGHPGSQYILEASKYLAEKYLPGFELVYLNHTGPKEEWSKFVIEYLKTIDDKLVIFALDDYLISDSFETSLYETALRIFEDQKNVSNVKLCKTTYQEHQEYPVTTQYTIWKRKHLIDLLGHTTDPWNFEIHGSKVFRTKDLNAVCFAKPIIKYSVFSCLSSRWQGIRWDGVKQEDLDYIQNNNLIK